MRLSKESLEFLVEFFKVLQSKNLKTDSQLLDILETYTDWDSSSGNLTLIDVPDELKDRFENFLKHINVLVTEGTYEAGYADMFTANNLINNTNDYLYSEYDEDDLEEFNIQSEVDDYVLYWVETGIMPECGGISVNNTKFEDPIVFTEITKIFELVDEDIEYIQKELTSAGIV